MSEKKQSSEIDGREILLLIAVGGGAFWYKYGYRIQMWVHENMVTVVLSAMALLTLLGYLLVRRFQKKHEEQINRMTRLREARAREKSPSQYYQRRPLNRDSER